MNNRLNILFNLILGRLNDLWKYYITDNKWIWISGNDTINIPGRYGNKGESSNENYPSSRFSSVSWLYNEDILYLFGGFGYGKDDKSFGMNYLLIIFKLNIKY